MNLAWIPRLLSFKLERDGTDDEEFGNTTKTRADVSVIGKTTFDGNDDAGRTREINIDQKLFTTSSQPSMSELDTRVIDHVKDELDNTPDDSDTDSIGNEINVADLFKCPSCFLIYAEADRLAQHVVVHKEKENLKKPPLSDPLRKPKAERRVSPRLKLKAEMPPCSVLLDRCDDWITTPPEAVEARTSKLAKATITKKIAPSSIETSATTASNCKRITRRRPPLSSCAICSKTFFFPYHFQQHLLRHGNTLKSAKIKVENVTSCTNLRDESKVKVLPQCRVVLTRCDQLTPVDKKPALPNILIEQKPINLKPAPNIHRKTKKFRCPICLKYFHSRTHLNFHRFTHSKERNYKCPLCPKTFTQPGNVNLHIRTHTLEKPYSCDQCSKGFAQLSQLQHHIPTHNLDVDKPHICKICSKGFSQLFNLKAHMNMHSGKTPYMCSICPRAFRHPGPLQTHVRGHSQERRYRCLHCPTAYAYPGQLKIHIRSHTGDRPYRCSNPKCTKRFINSTSLKQHMVRCHGKRK